MFNYDIVWTGTKTFLTSSVLLFFLSVLLLYILLRHRDSFGNVLDLLDDLFERISLADVSTT